MTLTFRRVAAALVLPAVLATASCGKQADPTPGPSAASTSAAPTSAAGSGRAAATTRPAAAAAQPYRDKAALIAGLKAGAASATTAHVAMDLRAAGQRMSMQGDTKIDAHHPAMRMSMDAGSQMRLQMVLVDDKLFIKGMPGLPAGKWAVVDSSSQVGQQLQGSLAQADPTMLYDQFDKAVTAVTSKGEASIGGERVHAYELTLDTSAMVAALPAGSAAKLPDTITYTAWVDDANHLRKVVFDVMGTTATMTMSRYGEPLHITAPPAAQTVKAPL